MDPTLLLGVSSAFLTGGVLVAIVNLMAGRRKSAAEARKLDAETASVRADTKRKRAETQRLMREVDALSPGAGFVPDIDGLVGWVARGSAPELYRFGVDRDVAHQGSGSGFIWSRNSKIDEEFGTLMQMFKAEEYRGSRYRLSAWIRSRDVERWAGLWMRVDGPDTQESGESLSFDNMSR